MICYESVYPHYVREFVRNGAEFLVIITNDSWWGNTSGAYQHAAFASFRAIETRRWIVRCANGGISGFVDPTGRMHQATDLYSAVILSGEIEARSDKTVYVRVGDALAQLCAVLAGGTLLIAFLRRRRKHDGAESHH
jgi:apolipoprotein N-acyltransferase